MRTITHIDPDELATATPVAIDTVLSEVYNRQHQLEGYLAACRRRLAKPSPFSRDSDLEAVARYEAELAELDAQAAAYRAEYDRRQWNRYFLVLNAGGHVHRGMDCTTCFPTTQYMWIVDLADCDEAQMIVEYGERACTVCFPDAPTHPAFDGPGRRDTEAKRQRELDRIERAAVRAAKTLEPELVFTDLNGWKAKTVAAAKVALREVAENRVVAGTASDYNSYYQQRSATADAVEVAARHALAAKGVEDAEMDAIMERAAKKARKEWGL